MDSMESEEVEPDRLSLRFKDASDNRVRSKTPIIIDRNVPRLSRQRSEDTLLVKFAAEMNERGRDRRTRNSGQRMSIEATINATNHHRTASLRRKREKKKKLAKQRKSQINLLSERRTSETSEPSEEISEASIVVNEQELQLETELYKNKFESLTKEFGNLETKLVEKETECSDLKNQLKTATDEARNAAELLYELKLQEIERILSELDSDSDENDPFGKTKRELADETACVAFGVKLF